MIPVSVCIVTYNEEENIAACLESVRWADEIVVVDSFSTDRTVEICQRYGAKVYQHSWPGHIEQKNRALGYATNDWVLCLDADERLSPELSMWMRGTFASMKNRVDGYFFPRRTFYLGRWITHGGWYPDYKLRLFRKSKGFWAGVNPHDRVVLSGQTQHVKLDILHYSYKNIADHLRKINAYTTTLAQAKWEEGKKSGFFLMMGVTLFKFFKAFILKRGFLDGVPGFIVAVLGAYYEFLKYAKLWEMNKAR